MLRGHAVALRGRLALSLAVALVLVGCTSPTASHGCDGMANDHVMLVDRLRCARMVVEIEGPADLPYLKGHGTVLRLMDGGVTGEARLLSLSYDDEDLRADGRAVAAADAAKFERDGSPKTPGAVTYEGTPHLFRHERVLVIYSGDDRVIIGTLGRLLGPQFAGG